MPTIDRPQIELVAVDQTKQAFDSVKRSFGSLKDAASGLQGSFAGIAAGLTAGAFAVAIKNVSNYGEALGKSSEKTGLAVESYAKLQYAAHLADVDNESLAKGLKGLAGNVYENDKAFAALGVSTRNSSGQIRNMDDVIGDIAEAFSGMEDGAGKSALAVRLFGKAGSDLIPLLNGGRQGLKDAGDEAQRFGLVLGGDAVKRMQEFNDNLKRIEASSQGAKISIGNDLIPEINKLLEQLLKGKELFGGFASAIYNLGTINPFRDVADNIKRLNVELADLEKRKAVFKDFGEQAPASLDADIANAKKRIEFLKLQQRQNLPQLDDKSLDETSRRFRVDPAKKKQAPNLPDETAIKRQAELYASALKSAQNLAIKTEDLTHFQEELARIEAGHYGKLLPAQQTELLNLAAKADLLQEDVKTQKEANDAVKKSQEETAQRTKAEADALNATAEAYKDLIDPIAQYVRKLDEIDKLEQKGLLTSDQALEARFKVNEQIEETNKRLNGNADAAKENNKAFEEMSDAASAALGRIISGSQGAQEALAGLLKYFADLIIKIAILEPLTKKLRESFKDLSNSGQSGGNWSWLTDLFGKSGGGAGGYSSSNIGSYGDYTVPAYATGTDYVPRDGLAYLHKGEAVVPAAANRGGGGSSGGDMNVSITVNADSNSRGQEISAAVVQAMKSVAREVVGNELRDGGVLAR